MSFLALLPSSSRLRTRCGPSTTTAFWPRSIFGRPAFRQSRYLHLQRRSRYVCVADAHLHLFFCLLPASSVPASLFSHLPPFITNSTSISSQAWPPPPLSSEAGRKHHSPSLKKTLACCKMPLFGPVPPRHVLFLAVAALLLNLFVGLFWFSDAPGLYALARGHASPFFPLWRNGPTRHPPTSPC